MTYATYTLFLTHEFGSGYVPVCSPVALTGPLSWVIGEARRRLAIQRTASLMMNGARVFEPKAGEVWSSISPA